MLNRHCALFFLLFIASCGGIATSTADAGNDATPQEDATAVDSSTNDVVNIIDGSADSTSDPFSVLCNGAPCDVTANYCCDESAVPPNGQRCVAKSVSSCGGPRRACDEAADCTSGQLCCIPPNAAMKIAYHTECSKGCTGEEKLAYQVCKTSQECANGQPCVAQICAGQEIKTCGALPRNRCE